MADINRTIADYRKKAGYTQAQAAELLGMKRSTYARLEKKTHPRLDILLKICQIFNIPPGTIIHPLPKPVPPKPKDPKIQSKTEKLSDDELNILKMYRSLPKQNKIKFKKRLTDLLDNN